MKWKWGKNVLQLGNIILVYADQTFASITRSAAAMLAVAVARGPATMLLPHNSIVYVP